MPLPPPWKDDCQVIAENADKCYLELKGRYGDRLNAMPVLSPLLGRSTTGVSGSRGKLLTVPEEVGIAREVRETRVAVRIEMHGSKLREGRPGMAECMTDTSHHHRLDPAAAREGQPSQSLRHCLHASTSGLPRSRNVSGSWKRESLLKSGPVSTAGLAGLDMLGNWRGTS
jgi:hypothetical protein